MVFYLLDELSPHFIDHVNTIIFPLLNTAFWYFFSFIFFLLTTNMLIYTYLHFDLLSWYCIRYSSAYQCYPKGRRESLLSCWCFVIVMLFIFCWTTSNPLVVLKMLLIIRSGTRKFLVEVVCFKILDEGEGGGNLTLCGCITKELCIRFFIFFLLWMHPHFYP